MRDRKKRNIIIASLCCLLVFMGIGYAILSQTLNISGIANMKGNWNVKITNMELVEKNKTGRAEEVSHAFTDTTATFEANLYMPGDSIEYEVTVENQGNIDAVLKSITPTTTNKNVNIKFSHSEIDNTVLTAGKTITFTMKVEFLEDATTIPDLDSLKYSLELVYVQYNGGDYTPAVESTEESCFMISDDGTLISYDRTCGGGSIVIPAKVNNIPVKRIMPNFLMASGEAAILQASDEGYSAVYMIQKDKLNKVVEYLKSTGEADDEDIQSITDSYKIYEDTDIKSLNPITFKDIVINYRSKQNYKVSQNSDKTYTLETTDSDTDYNLIKVEDRGRNQGQVPAGWYCKDQESCQLLKKALCSESTKEEEYANNCDEYMNNFDFPILEDLDYIYYSQLVTGMTAYLSSDKIESVDFSNAIYMDDFSFLGDQINSDSTIKVTLPPNIKTLKTIVIIEGVPVSDYSSNISEIIFPNNSITTAIGYDAFKWINLKNITLPKTLKVIGENSLKSLNVSKLTIPASVTVIGANATGSDGNQITELKFESNSNLKEIGENAFSQNNIKSVVIPKNVEYIGDSALYKNKLTSVSFEAGSKLKYIGHSAFANNQLTNTGLGKLPSALTSLATNAFSNNTNLTQITLTSPSDIEGWTNGSTVGGITVTYER